MVAVLLFCAVLVLPTATTGAFWISNHPAPATTAGRWCSVPNHELKPNLYRRLRVAFGRSLDEMPSQLVQVCARGSMEAPIGLWLHGHMPRLRDEIEVEIRGFLARRGPYIWWETGTALLLRDTEDTLSLIATDQDSGITLGARIVLPAHRGSPEWLRIMQPASGVEEWALHGFLFLIQEEVLTGGLARASVPDSDGVRWLAISE